jgi:hypothetical protein
MLNKNTGFIGLALGVVLTVVGIVVWVATVHHKTALGLIGLGIVVLAVGVYAIVASGKARPAKG